MKKLLALILIVISLSCFGQGNNMRPKPSLVGFEYMDWVPVAGYIRLPSRYEWIAGYFDSTFTLPFGNVQSIRGGGYNHSGALFYKTGNSSVYNYDGSTWRRMVDSILLKDTAAALRALLTGGGWNITGNSGTTAGTNFIGTTDAQALFLKVNNRSAGYISNGYVSDTVLNPAGNSGQVSLGQFAQSRYPIKNFGSVFLGYGAGRYDSSATENVFVGLWSGFYTVKGDPTESGHSRNVFIGESTGYRNYSGSWNFYGGAFTGELNATGKYNTGVGGSNLRSNRDGVGNTAAGYLGLVYNTTGLNTITLTTKGTGYTTAPTVVISAPTFSSAGAVTRQATATAVLTGDSVTSIIITDPGAGYTATTRDYHANNPSYPYQEALPTITFTGGGGTGAAAVATVTSGDNNSSLGAGAGYTNELGKYNTYAGYSAISGKYDDYGTLLGANTGKLSSLPTTVAGKLTNYSAIGARALVGCSNCLILGDTALETRIGIGTTQPDLSALLEVKSTTKGVLFPRMTKAQMDAISSPATGLIVYIPDSSAFYFYNSSAWTKIGASTGGGGSGTVNSGTQYRLAYYATTGTAVSEASAITASRALVSDANGVPTHATTTATEIGYVNGVTSALQTQLDGMLKQAGRSGGQTAIGGTGVGDVLTIQSTSANGTDATEGIVFQDGAVKFGAILNSGQWGIGTGTTANSTYGLTVRQPTDAASDLSLKLLANNGTTYSTIGYQKFKTQGQMLLESAASGISMTGVATGAVYVGGSTAPTAQLHIAAGSSTLAQEKMTSGTILTTAVAGVREYNGSHYETKGSGLRYAKEGVIADFYTDVDNSGTSETDLYSYTTPANTLANNGEKITFSFTIQLSDATATANIRLKFAGNLYLGTGAITIGTTGYIVVSGYIIRTSSSTVRATVSYLSQAGTVVSGTSEIDDTGLTLSGTNILKITGEAGGAGGGTGDIKAKLGTISWQGAAAN